MRNVYVKDVNVSVVIFTGRHWYDTQRYWGVLFKLGGRVRGTDGDLKLWFPSYETTIGITI